MINFHYTPLNYLNMRIAHIVCKFSPYLGGMGNVARQYAQELSGFGHEITVFTLKSKENKQNNEPTTFPFIIERLSTILRYGNAGCLFQLLWKLKKFDVVHLHYPFFGTTEIILLAKKLGLIKKLVLAYHMDFVGTRFLKIISMFSKKFILPKIIKLSDKVIVTSFDYAQQSTISEFIQSYPQKFIEIPLGVDLDKFKPENINPALLTKYKLNTNKDSMILFVANMDKAHYFKGVDILLRAAHKLKEYDYKLLIVGDGNMKLVYQTLAHELNILNTKVIFAGKITDEELIAYYNLCDFLVLPSINSSEAFGLVLIEAMACAKPVIASNLRGLRSVVDNNTNGLLFKAGDIDDLTDKIKTFLEHKDMVMRFGKNAHKKIIAKYNIKKIGTQLNEMYQVLCKDILYSYNESEDLNPS